MPTPSAFFGTFVGTSARPDGPFFVSLPRCLIGMEVCGSARHLKPFSHVLLLPWAPVRSARE